MHWKSKLLEIEQRRDWVAAVELLKTESLKCPELYYRVMFTVTEFLVEGRYSNQEHDEAEAALRNIYSSIPIVFLEDPEYLFFMGVTISLCVWYFDDFDHVVAIGMMERASKMEPNNLLFRYGYIAWKNQRSTVNTKIKLSLAEQLLNRELAYLKWLDSKGFVGLYVRGMIEGNYEYLSSLPLPE